MKRNDYVVRLLGMLKRYLLWFVASVSVKTANLSIPYLGAYLVSAWLFGQMTFLTFVAAAVVMTVLLVGTAFGDTYISHRMSFGIVKDLRNKCYSKIERLLPATESGKSLGDYERIINSDVDVFEWFYAHILVSWIATALVLMIGAICVARINIVALEVLIICSIVLIGIPVFHTKQAEEKGYELRKYGGELNAVIVDGILGMKDIISNQYEEEYTQKLMEKSRQFDRSREKFLNRGMKEKRSTELVINISYLMIAGIGVLGGEKDIAKTVTLLLLAFSFYGPLQQTLRDGTNYGFVFGAAKRV
ncbi:MAG: hypothetical protein K6G30_14970, partial [Acetatifactor sp.]|nr:hypothetical protein [Acetatifactor sp.]